MQNTNIISNNISIIKQNKKSEILNYMVRELKSHKINSSTRESWLPSSVQRLSFSGSKQEVILTKICQKTFSGNNRSFFE